MGGALTPTPSTQDLAWAVEVREAIRELVATPGGAAHSPAAVEVVDRAARMVSLTLRFDQNGRGVLRPAEPAKEGKSGLDIVIASVLGAMYLAMSDGTWSRVKVCRNPDCLWAFYDRSRNHSHVWCTMAECGNRMKARRFRRRRTEQEAGRGA